MSAFQYYKSRGYSPVSPKYRSISNATSANIVVWTPTTSMRIAVTNVVISCNPGGTLAFFFGGANAAQKLGEFTVGASSTVNPSISGWESTALDAPLYVTASTGGTNAWQITVEGFELD